jgi:NAD(P)-dependent dehydrogenase (short-subunit alcohol dehydrogenase family)
LLLPKLVASAPARIVTVTGSCPKQARFPFEDPQFLRDFHAADAAYRDNLGKRLLTEEFARRIEGTGVTANCIHPGAVRTALQRKLPWYYRVLVYPMLPFFQSPARGARGPLYLATASELSAVSGRYFRGRQLAPGPSAATDDATRLWDLAEHLTQPATQSV